MIAENQFLMYRNVVSKLYQVGPEDMELALSDFMELIESHGLTPTDLFFYTINSDLRETEVVLIELFIPVENSLVDLSSDEFIFRSYFFIDNMIMTRIESGIDEQEKTMEGTLGLIKYCVDNELTTFTPPFYKLRSFENKIYIEIYMGAARIIDSSEEEEDEGESFN